MTPESQKILDALLADGWREWPDHLHPERRLFAKAFPGHAKCRCNAPKNKQLEIYFRRAERIGDTLLPESWKIDNVGELPDGQWLRMTIESLSTHESILKAVRQLLAGWDHVVSITPSVPDPDDQ